MLTLAAGFDSALGNLWWTLFIAFGCFVMGALIGAPMFKWLNAKMPWSK